MRYRLPIAAFALVASMLSAPSAHAAPPGCAGDIGAAARLVHPGARIVQIDTVAGTRSALLSLPVVVPGVRHRLVHSRGLWCDAIRSFNLIAPGRSPAEIAEAFARLAPAPFFDGITVVRSAAAGSVVRLETHATTNGIVAEWVIHTDAAGVREASWIATDSGRPPFDAEWESFTARPGMTVSYRRQPDGTIRPSISPSSAPQTTGVPYDTVLMSDGFIVEIRMDPSGPGTPGLDVPAVIRDVTRTNYEDFLVWGLHGGWQPADRGVVEIDDSLASFCGACMTFSTGEFNVHIASDFIPYIESHGFNWADDRLGFSTVIGHEIFHNFQYVYGGTRAPMALIEGTARFQEALHDDSIGNHQPGSGLYANQGSSTCNGYVRFVARGPASHSYDACRFWLSWYADHGLPGLLRLMEHIGDGQFRTVVEQAGGTPFVDDLARFAARLVARRGMVWGPADGTGAVLDWGQFLNVWTPPITSLPAADVLQSGGMLGLEIDRDVLPVSLGPAGIFVVRDDGVATSVESIAFGTPVAGPAPGARAWVVAIELVDQPVPVALTAV